MVERAFITLFPALLLAGCFNPDYGDGGFICKGNECPDGYGCVHDGTKSRCKKGAEDGFEPTSSLTCTKPVKANNKRLMTNPASFDLALDYKDRPYLANQDDGGAIILSYLITKGGTAWKYTASGDIGDGRHLSAAVDSHHHLHIAHLNGGRAISKYVYVDSINPGGWKTLTLYNKNKVLDVDIDARPEPSSLPWYIIHAEDASAKMPSAKDLMVVGRLTSTYDVNNFCTRNVERMIHPVMAVGWVSSGDRAATSLFTETTLPVQKGWQVSYYEQTQAACTALKPLNCACPDHPGRIAVDSGGKVHASLSEVIGKGRGQLNYKKWNGQNTFTSETVIATPVVDPQSLDIAVDRQNRPCLSFFANGGGADKMSLWVACWSSDSTTPWVFSPSAIKVTTAAYHIMEKNRSNITRIAMGRDANSHKIQVAFTAQPSATAETELMYFTCDLPQ